MRRGITAALVACCTLVAAPGAQQTDIVEQSGAAFRAGVDVVSMNVTVADRDNRYVPDLSEVEFSVYEDGVQQDISFFSQNQLPLALSLLLDSSASMDDRLSTLQSAAVDFVRRLQPTDLAQVIDFDSRVKIHQAFTGDTAQLEAAIGRTVAGGSTSLYNALYISLKELRKVSVETVEDVRRQALVVFSDGEDTSSLVSFDEVLDLAKRSETAVYTIALRGEDNSTRGFREAEFVMRQLAQETGGRTFAASSVDDLTGIYSQIADELLSQYTIGYLPKNARRDGAWRQLVVQLSRPDTTARTKRGYYAPTSN
jgi:Ca-activated chloride channel family protein